MLKGVVSGKRSVNISRTNQVNQCMHIKAAQFTSQKTQFWAPSNTDQLNYICKDNLPVDLHFIILKINILCWMISQVHSNKSNTKTFPEFLLCTQVKI